MRLLPALAHRPHLAERLDRMITAIILCGDDAVGIINSEMSAEHHLQPTEIRKLARIGVGKWRRRLAGNGGNPTDVR